MTDDPASAVTLTAMLAILVGLIEVGLGVAKLGFVADLLSSEVRVGYLNGLAVTIILGQIPKLCGFSVDADSFDEEVREVIGGLSDADRPTRTARRWWSVLRCWQCSSHAELRTRLHALVLRYGLFETLDHEHFYTFLEEALAAVRSDVFSLESSSETP